MQRLHRLTLALVAALTAARGVLAQSSAPARERPATTSTAGAPAARGRVAAKAPARHMLWKVPGARNTVYLLGSVHALTPDVYPLAPVIERAFDEAERVVFELDLDSAMARAPGMLAAGRYEGGRTLKTELDPATYALLERKLAAYGLPAQAIAPLEPWLVALTLSQLENQRAGMRPEYGIDVYFNGKAQKAGKRRGALETFDGQIALFDQLPAAVQDTLLRSTLDNLDSTRSRMAKTVAAWRAGDVDQLDRIINRAFVDHPALRARLLVDRNRAWIPPIEQLLAGDDDVLVVVGAGHLVGKDGVVALLRQRGRRAEQL